MTLGSMKNLVRSIWDAITMPEIMIDLMKKLSQVQLNVLESLDLKNRPIGELKITGVDTGETESPHIELIESETDIDPISSGTEN